eukprot:scaffold92107_cov59-Phaeocystis_antarctica.AAC.2
MPLLCASHLTGAAIIYSGDAATGGGCTMRSRRPCAGSCPSFACRRSRLVLSREAQSRHLWPRHVSRPSPCLDRLIGFRAAERPL